MSQPESSIRYTQLQMLVVNINAHFKYMLANVGICKFIARINVIVKIYNSIILIFHKLKIGDIKCSVEWLAKKKLPNISVTEFSCFV